MLRYYINISFYILFYIILIIAFFIFLSNLSKIKRLIILIIYFMFFILHKFDFRYFFLYLRYVNACYFELNFMMLATYAF